jgi:hypothetical protein
MSLCYHGCLPHPWPHPTARTQTPTHCNYNPLMDYYGNKSMETTNFGLSLASCFSYLEGNWTQFSVMGGDPILILSVIGVALGTAIVVGVILGLMFPHYRRAFYSHFLNEVHAAYTRSKTFHAFGRIMADRKVPQGLPPLETIEKVSERCYRILGLNPGTHTLQGTNTWLLGTGDSRILVDTGEDITQTEYVTMLFEKAFPASGTKTLSTILLTHGHCT